MTNSMVIPGSALRLGRVLAPVDFSENCRRAARDAEWLARHFGAELALLHSVPHVEIPFGPEEAFAYATVAELDKDRMSERSAELEALAIELHGSTPRRVIVEDDPVHAILQFTAERRCDLIVMPTHGHGTLHRLVAGSVTAEVLRRAPCPVWTGCHYADSAAIPAMRNVVWAVDFGIDCAAVSRWAAGLAHEFGAALHMVHAMPEAMTRARGDFGHEVRQRLSEMTVGNARPHVPVGDVPAAVAEVAAEVQADVVVAGRGPKTYSIIRAVACPVLAV